MERRDELPIVVGVDGSAASHAALLLAADLAASLGGATGRRVRVDRRR